MANSKKLLGKKSFAARAPERGTIQRLHSGVPGLDDILGGGFLVGGTYLLLGPPGSGKTILANQISFHASQRDGQRALFVTLLAENHSRMFDHLETLSFFDRKKISQDVHFVSGYSVLEKDGLEGFIRLLSVLVRQHKSKILFIDGIASVGELSGTQLKFKKFVHHLNTVLSLSGCTTFLMTSVHKEPSAPEHTMVDGILQLMISSSGMRAARQIEVHKFRGSSHKYGRHYFQIDTRGITVFPRFETSVDGRLLERLPPGPIVKTGIRGLDDLMGGGLMKASTTALLGAPGTGKSTMGLKFLLQGVQEKQRGLFISFNEHVDRLKPRMKAIGVDIETPMNNGDIQLISRNFSQCLLDSVFYSILEVVRNEGIERLFIDGIGAMRKEGVLGCERLADMLTSLSSELKVQGVTSFIVEETYHGLFDTRAPLSYDSAITDNIIEIRNAQIDDRRTVMINVLKTRSTANDSRFYELIHAKHGPEIGRAVTPIEPYLTVLKYTEPPTGRPRSGRSKTK